MDVLTLDTLQVLVTTNADGSKKLNPIAVISLECDQLGHLEQPYLAKCMITRCMILSTLKSTVTLPFTWVHICALQTSLCNITTAVALKHVTFRELSGLVRAGVVM